MSSHRSVSYQKVADIILLLPRQLRDSDRVKCHEGFSISLSPLSLGKIKVNLIILRNSGFFLLRYIDEIIDAVLNHVKQGIIRTYDRHDYDKE